MSSLLLTLAVGLCLGLVLGLLGGGGGILAIPALVHLVGLPVDQASTTSLVVVAIGAAAGLVPHALAGRVDWRTGAVFGGLGVAGSVLGSRAALLADDRLQVAGLIALIFLAASGMLRGADDATTTRMRHRIPVVIDDRGAVVPVSDAGATAPPAPPPDPPTGSRPGWLSLRTLTSATVVGLVTGFFGVGGGFVAVPALVWGAGLPMRRATATGLVVIVINSLVSLAARGPGALAWPLTGQLAVAAAVGALVGAIASRRIGSQALKTIFGWLLLAIGFHEVWQLALQY